MGYYYCRKNKTLIKRTADKAPQDLSEFKVLSEAEYLVCKECLANLNKTDTKLLQFLDGDMTESDYASIKRQRAEWRARLRNIIG